METNNNKIIATVIHLSALTQYFIPFGGFIFPIIIWSSKKDSSFVDSHGRQIINFQLSVLLYTLLLAIIAIPILLFTVFKNIPIDALVQGEHHFNNDFTPANLTGIATVALIAVLLFAFLKIAEFFLIIIGAVRAANGELYSYPLTINFINSGNKTSNLARTPEQVTADKDQD